MNYFSKKKKWVAYLILLTFVFTCIVPTNLGMGNMVYAEETQQSSKMIDKTATMLDADDFTNVTLSVPGEQEQLGVDIIYIAGAYLAKNEVESDLMIASLYDTFTEIVGAGIPVNFGFVPFSYDDKPVMELTSYKTLEELDNLHEDLKVAIGAASGAYGGENMENALQVAKNMFAASPLASHPERQHLVLVSSGHTYNFNVGENNDIFSTVPVAIQGSEKVGKYYYGFKAWMQARNYNPNNYPIPRIFTTYKDYRDFDAYWAEIENWAAADVAAGDKVVYNILDTTDYSFGYNDWYTTAYLNQDSKKTDATYYAYGLYIHTATQLALSNGFDFTNVPRMNRGSLFDSIADNEKHAISYERAMWEASNFIDNEITGAGINFYPIYNQMKPEYTNGRPCAGGGTNLSVWTDQYIGHSFMNMLARNAGTGIGVDAVNNSTATDKAFFDPIKEKILYTCSVGSYVEDFVGYDTEKGNFEFVQDVATISMALGDKKYTTAQIDARNGADSSYSFTAPGAAEPTFWLDYYYGDGKTTERFVWTFGENVSLANRASLTYKLWLKDKIETVREGEKVSIYDEVYTNIVAWLYPKDSKGNEGNRQKFPVPEVFYVVQDKTVGNAGVFAIYKNVNIDDAAVVNNEFDFQLKVNAVTEQWDVSLISQKLAIEEEIANAQANAENAAGAVSDKEKAFRNNAVAFESSNYKLVMAEEPVETTSGSVYAYTYADTDDFVDITTGSAYVWNGKAEGDSSLIDDVIAAIKELAKEFSSLLNRIKFVGALNGLVGNTTGSAIGFHTSDAEALLFAERERLDAEEQVAKKEAALEDFIQQEVTTPAAITITLTPTEGSNLDEKVYELQPVEGFKSEDGNVSYDENEKAYRINFHLFGKTGYAVTVDATTGTMIDYMVSEYDGFNIEGYQYDGTEVKVANETIDPDEYLRNTGVLKLDASEDAKVISFLNKYSTNTPPPGGDDYTPPSNNGGDYTPPKQNPEENIDDPKVPLGDVETPDEIIDDPEIPLGDKDMPDEELDETEIPLGDAPATGDSANAVPFMALLLAAIIGLAITRRKFN